MPNPPDGRVLRPFLAPLLARRAGGAPAQAFLRSLRAEIEAQVSSSSAVARTVSDVSSVQRVGGLQVQTVQYVEESAPPWAPSSTLRDRSHQLVVVAVKGDLAAICASDSSFRRKLGQALTVARPVVRDIIEQGFVGDQASVLWLNGVHTPTDVRPNAKTLMGNALEFALDPLGDQSFYYSAVRSRVGMLSRGAAPRYVSIGAAPGSGRIWINRPQSWTDFLADVETVLDRVARPPAAVVRFAALAKAAADLRQVSDAFALAFVPPELMSDEDVSEAERENAVKWAYGASFEVRPGAGAELEATVRQDGTDLGDVVLRPALINDRIEIDVTWARVTAGHEDLRKECTAHLIAPEWPKLYYESGHTIVQGHCYLTAYRDQPFAWTFRSFAGFDVTREKPERLPGQTLATSIGVAKVNGHPDDSLFGFALNTIGQTGWLASDDGSMEFADFVHIADDDLVTLIHAKGSNSAAPDRQVSVSNYEVVVGQAIKNLRHLERMTLAEALQKGRHKQIAGAVWHDNVMQRNRAGIIARARRLPGTYRQQLVVLQPQLTRAEHDACVSGRATPGRIMRMKQLNTLMLGAQLSAAAVGATFAGWASE